MEDDLLKIHILMANHPTRVPVLIEKGRGSTVGDLDRHKYLLEKDMTMGHVVCLIRSRIKIRPEQAIFIFVDNGILPPNASHVGQIYEAYKSGDGMLRITYRSENTFG
jgi:GABA(A) receptor-associated protein